MLRGQMAGGQSASIEPQYSGSQQAEASELANIDPMELLGQQHGRQLERLEAEFGQQEGELKQAFTNQVGSLESQYNIERRYIEKAQGVDRGQKIKQLNQLNKKYELKINDTQGRFNPHMQELGGRKRQALAEMNARRGRQEMELAIINKLAEQGVISDPAMVQQQKLQAIGVNLPIKMFRRPRPEDVIKDAQQELRAVEDVLNYFEPGHSGKGWPRKKPLRVRVFNPEFSIEELEEATPQQKALHHNAVKRQRELQNIIAQQSVGAFLFSKAADEAAGLGSGNPMANKTADLLEQGGKQQKKQLTPEELKHKGTRAAYKRGVELGYWQ